MATPTVLSPTSPVYFDYPSTLTTPTDPSTFEEMFQGLSFSCQTCEPLHEKHFTKTMLTEDGEHEEVSTCSFDLLCRTNTFSVVLTKKIENPGPIDPNFGRKIAWKVKRKLEHQFGFGGVDVHQYLVPIPTPSTGEEKNEETGTFTATLSLLLDFNHVFDIESDTELLEHLLGCYEWPVESWSIENHGAIAFRTAWVDVVEKVMVAKAKGSSSAKKTLAIAGGEQEKNEVEEKGEKEDKEVEDVDLDAYDLAARVNAHQHEVASALRAKWLLNGVRAFGFVEDEEF